MLTMLAFSIYFSVELKHFQTEQEKEQATNEQLVQDIQEIKEIETGNTLETDVHNFTALEVQLSALEDTVESDLATVKTKLNDIENDVSVDVLGELATVKNQLDGLETYELNTIIDVMYFMAGRVNDIKNKVSNVESDVNGIETKVDDIDDAMNNKVLPEMSTMKGMLSGVETNLNDIETKVAHVDPMYDMLNDVQIDVNDIESEVNHIDNDLYGMFAKLEDIELKLV